MENINKTNKSKFLLMGAAALTIVYGLEVTCVALHNNYQTTVHEMKAVKIYNDIWKNIDKKDITDKISSYRELIQNRPSTYKVGILPYESEKVIHPSYLPKSDEIEKNAQILNKKVKIF